MPKSQILIVEDDSAVCSTLKRTLENWGYGISGVAGSGEAALKCLAEGKPDLVLMDIVLKGGMDGIQTASEIRAQYDLPVVFLTAYADEKILSRAKVTEPLGYVLKPFENAQLKGVLEMALYNADMGRRLKASRRELEKSRQSFQSVVEKSADGLIVLTRGGVVRFANAAVKTLFRREPEELIGRPLPFRLSPDGAAEIEILRRGGVTGTGEVHVTETEWEGAPALLASIRDISERKLAEQRLRDQTQALDAANAELKQANAELEKLSQLKTEFVSTVSHELRTPLTVIKTNIANLLNEASGPLTEAQKKWAQKINHHCTRLDDLLGGILDLSKLESGRLETRREPTDVGPLIRQLAANLTALAKEKQIALSCRAPENLPWIYADPMRIEQVLTNLIVNAVKFTQPKGSVLVSARQEKDCVQVSVSDNGPGVAPEHREAIFDRFRQIHGAGERRGSGGGIGLGLAICRQIISQHRGRIWVESDAGVGSNFIFQIPLETSNRILVADGDEATRRTVEELLSAKGYPVTACACGEEAIRLLSDPGRQFGLVFLELMFQDIGGVEVVKALRRRHPHVPIVLLTGDTNRSLLFQAMTLSPLTVISKPFKGQDILDTVGKLLPKWRKS